jgi:hypothetical protein
MNAVATGALAILPIGRGAAGRAVAGWLVLRAPAEVPRCAGMNRNDGSLRTAPPVTISF